MPKYIGEYKATYPGIPTADMSKEQWAKVEPELQKKLVAWGMFDVSDLDEPKPESKPAPSAGKEKAKVSNVS